MRIGVGSLPAPVAATLVAGLLAATPLQPFPANALTIDSPTQLLAGRFICDENFKKCVETVSDKGVELVPEGESAQAALEKAKRNTKDDEKAQKAAQQARFTAAKAAAELAAKTK